MISVTCEQTFNDFKNESKWLTLLQFDVFRFWVNIPHDKSDYILLPYD